jgi:actin-like ATPase involved in cell morphogenesis
MAISKLFTYFSALGMRTGTATAAAGAATLNAESGVVTSEALTTAAAASYTLTITNSKIKAGDIVLASVAFGTSTTGEPAINRITPADGSVVIIVRNEAAAAALNGTIKVAFATLKV